MKRYLPVFVFIFCLFTSGLNCQTGRFKETFINNGILSDIFYYIPEDYKSTEYYPFIFGWTDINMPASEMRNVIHNFVSSQGIKAIIACPEVSNCTTSDQFTNLIIVGHNQTIEFYNVDTNKVILTGIGKGCKFAYQMGLLYVSEFIGVIGVSPELYTNDFNQDMWNNVSSTRIANIIGDQDPVYISTNGIFTEIENKGGAILNIVKTGLGDNVHKQYIEFNEDYLKCYNFIMGLTDIKNSDTESDIQLSLGPNPAIEYVNIDIQLPSIESIDLKIYNLAGIEVYHDNQKVSDSHREFIDVSSFPAGIYVVKIKAGDKQIIWKLLKI